jgi:hypothetical protein
MELNEQTHDIFFKVITRKKLNELLLRASDQTILQKQINGILPKGHVNISVISKTTECGIYFNYYINTIKQGHITLHFKKADKIRNSQWGNPNINIGRFHLKNNMYKNKKYTLRINKQNNDKIQIYLTHRIKDIRPELQEFTKTVLDKLNMYFNPGSSEYLGYYKFPNQKHPCMANLDRVFMHSRTPLRNTRKKGYSSTPLRTNPSSLSYKIVSTVAELAPILSNES